MLNRTVSLRARILVLMGFVFAVFLGRFAYLAFIEREVDIASAKLHLLRISEKIAAEQNRIVAYADQYLDGLMRLPRVREIARLTQLKDAPDAECSRFLAEKLKEAPPLMVMGVVAPNGDALCSAAQPKFAINVADRLYFQVALKTRELIISDVLASRANNKSTIVFAKAMRDDTEAVRGVVWISLDLAWLNKELAGAKLPEGAGIGLFDGSGTVLARHPDTEGWVGKDASGTPLFKSLLAKGGEGAIEQFGFGGDQRLYAFTRFADTVGGRIFLWISVPQKAITAHIEHHFAWNLAITAALLLLVFGAAWWGGERMLVRPIAALSDAARRLAQGELGARTGLRHADSELGQLARSFDGMAESIKASNTQLLKANRALRVLSAGNRTLLRATDETDLLKEMCRAVGESGGYRSVWVGYAQDKDSVRVVGSWSAEEASPECQQVRPRELEGTAGTAIRHGIPIVVRNTATEPSTFSRQELSPDHRFGSILSLPLRLNGDVTGALVITAEEPDAFNDEEIALLREAAADLSFGVTTARARSKQVHLEVSLKTAEERFLAAAAANMDALFILKSVRDHSGAIVDFQFTDVNASATKMLGMARENIIGETLCELMPVSRNGLFHKYAQVANTRTPLEEEFPNDSPEIGAKWLRHQVVAVGDGIAIFSRDITEWKASSQKLRENEELLRLAMSAARMGAWSRDLRTDTLIMSDEVDKLLGHAVGETPRNTRALLESIHPADRVAARQIMSRPAAEAPSFTLETRANWPDGTVHWLLVQGMMIDDAAGKPLRQVGIALDITERKEAEESLTRAVRALITLSAGYSEVARAQDEVQLLKSVCHVIVDKGGYRLAAVGYAEDDPGKSFKPMAWAGFEEGYLRTRESRTWADTEKGQMPISKAIRSGKPEVARDIQTDSGFAPWREESIKRGYASNLAVPLSDGARNFGSLSIYSSDPDAFDEGEIELLRELGNSLAFGIVALRVKAERNRIAYEHEHHGEILRQSLEQSIQAIADTIEARDPYTAGHQQRVAQLAVAIAREMRLPEDTTKGIHLAASIHDLGKIKVPAEILAKPGKLTEVERMLIRIHPQAAYEILKEIAFPWPIAEIVWQHHEKLDGSGYPQGLKGGQILQESRLVTVADVVEAMSSHRPYRPALGMESALKEIKRSRGVAYDPVVVDACLALFEKRRFAFQE